MYTQELEQIKSMLENYSYANNSAWNFALAGGIFILSWLLLWVFRKIVLIKLKRMSKKTVNQLDDILTGILESIGPFSYPALSIYLGLRYLNFGGQVNKIISVVFVFILAYEAIKAFKVIFDFYLERSLNKKSENEDDKKSTRAVMQIIRVVIVAIMWVVVLLLVLSNLGVNVSSVVASLGIGGIAIALAIQNVLGDLLSSFSIYMDKPFVPGDYIVIGTDKGIVERIGLKTTRLRSVTGEELIISNKELTTARINNYKRMERRRDEVLFGVTYDTSKEKMEKIPNLVKEIIDSVDELEYFRCHFVEFGDFSLNFSLMYYVNTADYDIFLNAKQGVLLQIFDKFKKEKIDFAYPTQEVIVKK
jgi:small-conductance mechanosensitive channel